MGLQAFFVKSKVNVRIDFAKGVLRRFYFRAIDIGLAVYDLPLEVVQLDFVEVR